MARFQGLQNIKYLISLRCPFSTIVVIQSYTYYEQTSNLWLQLLTEHRNMLVWTLYISYSHNELWAGPVHLSQKHRRCSVWKRAPLCFVSCYSMYFVLGGSRSSAPLLVWSRHWLPPSPFSNAWPPPRGCERILNAPLRPISASLCNELLLWNIFSKNKQ